MVVRLSPADRRELKRLLNSLPHLATARGRREALRDAGLEQFVARIDLAGPIDLAVGTMISDLASYGRLTWDHEALGRFLNSTKENVGPEGARVIDRLLLEYNMMPPIARPPDLGEWRGRESFDSVQEKIIGEPTLRPIAFLTQGLEVARSVAYVGPRSGSGTGFMVTPDLFLTNHHVIPAAEDLGRTIFRFNYEENFQGEAQVPREYRAKVRGTFRTNEELDYTLVELDDEPGRDWGWLPLRPRDIRRGERTNIIQHPDGRSKHISFQNNFVEYVDENVVQYITSTKRGSSGSPVLDDEWKVVALHHSGGDLIEPATGRKYFRNEGILTNSILNDLPPEIRDLVDAAESRDGPAHA